MPPRQANSQASSQQSDSPLPMKITPTPIQESPSKRMTYNQQKHTPLLAYYLTKIFQKQEKQGKTKGISAKKIDEFFKSDSNISDFITHCKLDAELKTETIKNKASAIKEKLKSEKKTEKKEKKEKNDDNELNELIKKAYFTEMEIKFGGGDNGSSTSKKRAMPPSSSDAAHDDDDDTDDGEEASGSNSQKKRKV